MESDGARARRVYSKPERQAALMHLRRVVDEGGSVARAATELRIPKHTLYTWRDVTEGRRKRPKSSRRADHDLGTARVEVAFVAVARGRTARGVRRVRRRPCNSIASSFQCYPQAP